jgi:DNA-binding XRE family transcriptional regulator
MHRDANSKEPSIKKEKSDLWEVTSFEIPLPRDQVTTKTPGDNLKTLRTYSRTTQKNIAEAIGVSRSYISKMENNQVVIPYHIAKRLSSFFNISTNNFI